VGIVVRPLRTAVLDVILYLVSAPVLRLELEPAVELAPAQEPSILRATIFVDQPTTTIHARRPNAALNSKSKSSHVNEFD
jgi:hypothetical protein